MATQHSMRVLMLDPAGSSAHVTHNLCNHLAELGCDVHVFTAPHWLRVTNNYSKVNYHTHICFYRGTQMRSYEAKTQVARLWWRVIRFFQHIRAMTHIWAVAREYDVVHTQILSLPAFTFLFLRMISRRTRIVCTVHELVPHKSKHRRLTGKLFQSIYRLAKVLFVYTDYTRNRLVDELRISPHKIMNVPHGSLDELLNLEDGTVPESGDPVVLFIGNIRPDKGVDILIQAAPYLRKTIPRCKIVIAGSPGLDMSPLRQMCRDLVVEDTVQFYLGFMPESEFAARLKQATVVVLPYRRIEQSGVAIAACTLGKAIVATRCGGLEEMVTEAGNGLLVPVDDAVALADALATLLSDENKRKTCESRSRDYALRHLSWESIASKTLIGYKVARMEPAQVGDALTERP